jgi:hypothetical protein
MHKGHEATRVLRVIFVALVLRKRLARFMVATSLAGLPKQICLGFASRERPQMCGHGTPLAGIR